MVGCFMLNWNTSQETVVLKKRWYPIRSEELSLDTLDRDQIGIIFAWLCTCCYLSSRIPQIIKNYKRKSAEGLSIFMFIFAAIGNLTYVMSILIRDASIENIRHSLPFLLGSGGTLLFDITIFTQYYYYRHQHHRSSLILTVNDEIEYP
jgi:uncharacterized protein with PQ loop repeat